MLTIIDYNHNNIIDVNLFCQVDDQLLLTALK